MDLRNQLTLIARELTAAVVRSQQKREASSEPKDPCLFVGGHAFADLQMIPHQSNILLSVHYISLSAFCGIVRHHNLRMWKVEG